MAVGFVLLPARPRGFQTGPTGAATAAEGPPRLVATLAGDPTDTFPEA